MIQKCVFFCETQKFTKSPKNNNWYLLLIAMQSQENDAGQTCIPISY